MRVVYYQRRNIDCETMIERRFFSVGEAQYDDRTVLRQAETTAPVTPQYLIWSRRLTVPPGLRPGHYLYHPVLRCAGYPAVAAPPALFEVTDDEARWRGGGRGSIADEERRGPRGADRSNAIHRARMKLNRRMSPVEAIANLVVGYGIAVLTQLIVFPWFGLPARVGDALAMGAVLTLVSLVRGFALRRLFEAVRVRASAPPQAIATPRDPAAACSLCRVSSETGAMM